MTNGTALKTHNEGNLIFIRLKEETFCHSFNDSILHLLVCLR